MQETITGAFHTLAKAGYSVFYSVNPLSPLFVIEDPEGLLLKVYIRRVSLSNNLPLFTLSTRQRASIVSCDITHLLLCEVASLTAWLLPLSTVPAGVHSFRLTEAHEAYRLLPSASRTSIRNTIIKTEILRLLSQDTHETIDQTGEAPPFQPPFPTRTGDDTTEPPLPLNPYSGEMECSQ